MSMFILPTYSLEKEYGAGTIVTVKSSDVSADLIYIQDQHGNSIALTLEEAKELTRMIDMYIDHYKTELEGITND